MKVESELDGVGSSKLGTNVLWGGCSETLICDTVGKIYLFVIVFSLFVLTSSFIGMSLF